MKNRSRMEILYDIVSAAKSPVKKTNLMYKSNLSFKQLELYLQFLVDQGLIEHRAEPEGAGNLYGATTKGFQFTSVFEDLQSYLTISNPLKPMDQELRETEIEAFPTPQIQLG